MKSAPNVLSKFHSHYQLLHEQGKLKEETVKIGHEK